MVIALIVILVLGLLSALVALACARVAGLPHAAPIVPAVENAEAKAVEEVGA